MTGFNGYGGFASGLAAGAEVGNQIMRERLAQQELAQKQAENDQQFGLSSAFQRLRQQALDDELQTNKQNREFAAAKQPYDLASAKAQAGLVSPLGQAQLDISRANVAHTNAVTASIPEELGIKRAYTNAQTGALGAAAEQTGLENQGKRIELDQMEQQRAADQHVHDALLNAIDPNRHHMLTDDHIGLVSAMYPNMLDPRHLKAAQMFGQFYHWSPEDRNAYMSSPEGKAYMLAGMDSILDRLANADGSRGKPYDIRDQADLWHLNGANIVGKRVADADFDTKHQDFRNIKLGVQLRADTPEQQQQIEHNVAYLQDKYKGKSSWDWGPADRQRLRELELLQRGGTLDIVRPLTMDRQAGGDPMAVPIASLANLTSGVASVHNALGQAGEYGQNIQRIVMSNYGKPAQMKAELDAYHKQVRDAAVKAQDRQQKVSADRLDAIANILKDDPDLSAGDKVRVLERRGLLGTVQPRSPWGEDFLQSIGR